MEIYGYAGKDLWVNLSSGSVEYKTFDLDIAKSYIGGCNLNMRMAYDFIKPGIDPLSSENALIVGAGPLVGTLLPGTSKSEVTTKSPLTGTIGTCTNGEIGAPLKWAGYDHLVITGKAESPVYLKIFDDDVEICDASSLWGKDIHEASDALWDRYGGDCTVACIGPAGENKVKISLVLVDKRGSWGRGGFGAVLGSKNLKAIVIRGTKGITVANPEGFSGKCDDLRKRHLEDPRRQEWTDLGTTISLEGYALAGSAAWKNWREGYPYEKHVAQYGEEAYRKVRQMPLACPSCPTGCKGLYRIRDGEFAGLESPHSCNVGGVISFGTHFDLGNYNRVIKCYDTANRLGIDSEETAYMLSYLIDLQEQGVISSEDTDDMVLRRDMGTLIKWMEKITYKEGFGDIIGNGWKAIFEKLGKGTEKYAIQIKNMAPDMDARGNLGVEGLGVAVSIRGSHDNLALGPTVVPGRSPQALRRYGGRIGIPAEAMDRVFVGPSGFNIGRLLKHVEAWNALLNTMGICSRPPIVRLYDLTSILELYHLATGIKLAPSDVLKACERGWCVSKVFNAREGFTRKDDSFPDRWFDEPIMIMDKEYWLSDYGRTKRISRTDFNEMLDDYYEEKGCDVETGIPTREKLIELGLKEIVRRA